jgi:hypothetical protein
MLLEVIGRGIAFHNSDLSPEEREASNALS